MGWRLELEFGVALVQRANASLSNESSAIAQCQLIANASEDAPFYQVNEDWYRIARTTGGLFAPVRPPGIDGASCSRSGDLCSPRNPPMRQVVDPECRSQSQQIEDYFNFIMGQEPFTLVETKASLRNN